ncbi:MAG: alpha/beta hydrolase [Spirochaetes bacterium]|nr:alpha/beta hydrolase [Spirochaetota bacterium]
MPTSNQNSNHLLLKPGRGSKIEFHANKNKVVLLVHCFRSNPILMDEIATELYQNNFSIYNLRLPGHGYVNEERVFEVRQNDWLMYIENVFLDLVDNFKEVYLIGHSISCALLLQIGAKYSRSISKMVILTPFLKVKSMKIKFAPFLNLFKKKIKPKKIDCSLETPYEKEFISFLPLKQGIQLLNEAAGYRKKIKEKLPPTLCIFAENDEDINTELQKSIIKQNPAIKILTLEKSKHQVTIDCEKLLVFNHILSYFGKQNV